MQEFDDRDAWLEERKKYVTATEMASLFGLNPWRSGNKILQVKLGLEEDDFDPTNEYCKRGKELEPAVIKACELRLDTKTEHAAEGKELLVTDKEARISCTPDSFIYTAAGEKKILECKATGFKNLEYWKDTPPLYYVIQVHVQMMVTNLKTTGFLAGMFFGDEFPSIPLCIQEIRYDERIESLMKQEVSRFWGADTFRVNSNVKKEMYELLLESMKNVYKEII